MIRRRHLLAGQWQTEIDRGRTLRRGNEQPADWHVERDPECAERRGDLLAGHPALEGLLDPDGGVGPGDDDEDLEVLLMEPAQLDAALAGGDEYLDGKSVTAWFRARQLLDL